MSVVNDMDLNMGKREILHLGIHNGGEEKMEARRTFQAILSAKCIFGLIELCSLGDMCSHLLHVG